MNFPRDTEMTSPIAMSSNLSDLQTLLMNSGQQQQAMSNNGGGDGNISMLGMSSSSSCPWPSRSNNNNDATTPMMRWDQGGISNSQDFNNRLPFPTSFSNLGKIGRTTTSMDGSIMPKKRFNNLPAVFATESSPSFFGKSGGSSSFMSAKNLLGNASMSMSMSSRMKMKSSSQSNLKSSNNNIKKVIKKSSSLGGFPMPRLGKGGASLNKKKSTTRSNGILSLALSVACGGSTNDVNGGQSRKSNNMMMMNDDDLTDIHLKTIRYGCFPLPKLRRENNSNVNSRNNDNMIPYSLECYRDLWFDSHDGEVNREVFSRRLQRCCTIACFSNNEICYSNNTMDTIN